jgi:hypothetical protein
VAVKPADAELTVIGWPTFTPALIVHATARVVELVKGTLALGGATTTVTKALAFSGDIAVQATVPARANTSSRERREIPEGS